MELLGRGDQGWLQRQERPVAREREGRDDQGRKVVRDILLGV